MATINTNMAANIATNSMTRNERSMGATMERLSTGLRINSAKDDAAGLAISSKMTSQIRGLNQAVRNANDAISMIQVAEGAMKEVTNMFQRMRELAVQAISDSNTENDRTALNNEYKQLSAEVRRVAGNTQWNGTNILDGDRTSTTFQVGANASQTIDVDFGTLGANITASVVEVNGETNNPSAAGPTNTVTFTGSFKDGDTIAFTTDNGNEVTIAVDAAMATDLNDGDSGSATLTGTVTTASGGNLTAAITSGTLVLTGATQTDAAAFTISDISVGRGTQEAVNVTDITTSANANSALDVLDTAVNAVNATRAGLGASMSRLEYASDNLQNVAQNTSSARSRVLDADYAAETTELARTQIIQQAATAMLAQANQSQQAVLSLLKS